MATYHVDLDDLARAFPDALPLPPLLSAFGQWLAGKPWRAVGAFDLAVRWSDGHFPGGERHYDTFALFIRLPDGSDAGYWLGDRDLAHAPLICLGSEGDFTALAPSLDVLLARIALGDFDAKGPESDFLYSGEDFGDGVVPDLRRPLQDFLKQQTGVQDLASLARKASPPPSDFAAWVKATSDAYEARMRAHPAMHAMASLLDPYRPPETAKPWETTMINIAWAGPIFDAWIATSGPRDLAEAEQLRPHLAVLRDEEATQVAGLGLWHRATLMVSKDGIALMPDYVFEPAFLREQASVDAFKADQARAPRVARRIPAWLVTKLSA